MSIRKGRFQTDDKDEILSRLIDGAERSFDETFSDDDIHALVQFMEPIAEYFAKQQQDLREVLDSAHIEHAEDQSLTYIGSLLGVPRLQARGATTPVQFRSDGPVTRSYTAPAGTRVQTDDADPITFETDEAASIQYIEGFEDNDLSYYVEDTGSFTIQTSVVGTGSYALEGTSNGQILNGTKTVGADSRIHADIQLTAGAIGGLLYGGEDDLNYYEVELDESASTVSLLKVEGGGTTTMDSKSVSLPTGEFLHVTLDWMSNSEHAVTVEDSSGTELVSVSATETNQNKYSGRVGFETSTTNSIYFDEVTMSRAAAEATATVAGPDGNVGPDTLTIPTTSLSGVDSVTNPHGATGGRNDEDDEDFRDRIKNELAEGTAATFESILSALDTIEGTRTVTIIVNDDDSEDADGRPAHSFEPIVDVNEEYYQEVAEAIAGTISIGDGCVAGYNGSTVTQTVEYSNGQTEDIEFSVPQTVGLRTNLELTKTNEYGGDIAVKDSIVRYTGGTLSTGENVDGEIGAGDDIIYNQVMEAVMDVDGVHDVTTLEIYTGSVSPTTSNISIADGETATSDADTLDVTSSDV